MRKFDQTRLSENFDKIAKHSRERAFTNNMLALTTGFIGIFILGLSLPLWWYGSWEIAFIPTVLSIVLLSIAVWRSNIAQSLWKRAARNKQVADHYAKQAEDNPTFTVGAGTPYTDF